MSKKVETLPIKIIETRKTRETCYCDICGNQIYKRSLVMSEELPNNDQFVYFWEGYTGHNDWGTDSADSIENMEICSANCLQKCLALYINASNEPDRNTKYIDIKHTSVYCYEGFKEVPHESTVPYATKLPLGLSF